MTQITFEGPEGQLEGILELGEPGWGAVLCHPHPLYGGSMNDGVLQALHRGFAKGSGSTLRFNFRGVGASTGRHDEGAGEVDDVLAAVEFLKSQGVEQVVLAGYSFGAVMCLKAASRLAVEAMVLVAPPLQMLDEFSRPAIPCLVILGSEDQVVDANETASGFADREVELINGADHFFFDKQDEIERLVASKGEIPWS